MPRVADTLARAFAPLPEVRAALPGERYAERLHELYALFAAVALEWDTAWLAGDGAAAALWQPPAAPTGGAAMAAAEERLPELLGAGFDAYVAGAQLCEEHRPREPHWYLDVLGTAPEHRRRGLARAAVAPVLAACDDQGVAAVVDTPSAHAARLYARWGFEPLAEYEEPAGGPPVRMLRRPPRAG